MEKIKRDRNKNLYKKRMRAWDLVPKQPAKSRALLIACLVLIGAAAVLFLLPQPEKQGPVTGKDPVLPSQGIHMDEHGVVSYELEECEPKGRGYFAHKAFIGDALTTELSELPVFSKAKFAAHKKLNPENVLSAALFDGKTAVEFCAEQKIDTVYISLGANGASWMNVEQMIYYLNELVNKLREDNEHLKVIFLSAPQYSESTSAEYPNYDNENIALYNDSLKELAAVCGAYYLDTGAGMTASLEEGQLWLPEEEVRQWADLICTNVPRA